MQKESMPFRNASLESAVLQGLRTFLVYLLIGLLMLSGTIGCRQKVEVAAEDEAAGVVDTTRMPAALSEENSNSAEGMGRYLGVSIRSVQYAVEVVSVTKGSPATNLKDTETGERISLSPNDMILEINNVETESATKFKQLLKDSPPVAFLRILIYGEKLTRTVMAGVGSQEEIAGYLRKNTPPAAKHLHQDWNSPINENPYYNNYMQLPQTEFYGGSQGVTPTPTSRPCPYCNGTGTKQSPEYAPTYGTDTTEKWCSVCGMTVRSNHYHINCIYCGGTGKMTN